MAIKIVFYLGKYASRWCVRVFYTEDEIKSDYVKTSVGVGVWFFIKILFSHFCFM